MIITDEEKQRSLQLKAYDRNTRDNITELSVMILFILILLSLPNFSCNNEQSRQSDEVNHERSLDGILNNMGLHTNKSGYSI
jgi:hypothetical protein